MTEAKLEKFPRFGRIKERRYKDRQHLEFIRSLPCCVCMEDRSDMHRAAHHALRGPIRGMGRKAGDNWVIPMCSKCHSALHNDGDETCYLASYGVNVVELSKQLWRDHYGPEKNFPP